MPLQSWQTDLPKNLKSQMTNVKVVVAMSGGIDSSVAAALLKRQGFNVMGVFMRLVSSDSFRKSQEQAKKIAEILKIPFLVLDLRKEFKKRVIDYFIKELKLDKTPNPCVVCNKEIKFGLLLKEAKKRGVDFIATGHYAYSRQGKLFLAKDKEKDQSYFLGQLNQQQLRHISFPLGDYTKSEVKKMAKDFGIAKLARPESTDICFIKTTIQGFLKKHLKSQKGKIIDTDNKIIGKHNGLWFYTIGQRKGIEISGKKPYYVLDKDIKKNLLIVTKKEEDLFKKELISEKINWISGKKPKLPMKVKAKIRYRHKSASAIVTPTHRCVGVKKIENLKVVFDKPQRAITPGQLVVFYQGQELLGSGIIQ